MFYYKTRSIIVSRCITLLDGKELLWVWSIPSVLVPILGVKYLENLRSMTIVLLQDDMSLKLHLTTILAIGNEILMQGVINVR